MEVINLFGGSKGNSTLVQFDKFNILIDAGKNRKQINIALEQLGLSLDDIKLIFITHRHIDHINAIGVIKKNYPNIKYVMTQDIFNDIEKEHTYSNLKWKFDKEECIIVNERKVGNAIDITPFELNHDVYCVGYLIEEHDTLESLVFISDNGRLWEKDTINLLKNKTYYMIESNHDRTLQILDKKRDTLLKRRVLGSHGHTNNYDAMNLAIKLVSEDTKSVCFHHLSQECNNEQLAFAVHNNMLSIRGERTRFKNVNIQYAKQDEITHL